MSAYSIDKFEWTSDRLGKLRRYRDKKLHMHECCELLGISVQQYKLGIRKLRSQKGGKANAEKNRPTSFWTDERVKILMDGRAAQQSASQIAAVLGCTRSAVLGKLLRMGLHLSLNPNLRAERRRTTAKASGFNRPKRNNQGLAIKLATHGSIEAAHEKDPGVEAVLPILENTAEIPATAVVLDDLAPNGCRYVYGDPRTPEHRWCGREKLVGTSYCAEHASRCLRVLEPARPHMKFRPKAKTFYDMEDA